MKIRRFLAVGILTLLVIVPAAAAAQDDQQLKAIRGATDKYQLWAFITSTAISSPTRRSTRFARRR
jgi:hypothetical protein